MSYFSIVLSQIIGFVIYLLIGMVAVRMHVLDSRSLGMFSQFITKVSMPLLLFTNTLNGATRQQFISALPILAEKLGVDPAVMANPLISTVTDAVSLLIYIYVAKIILHI